ncbi:hypothetical protein PHET_11232, partial [Paragonimus heterotremus]
CLCSHPGLHRNSNSRDFEGSLLTNLSHFNVYQQSVVTLCHSGYTVDVQPAEHRSFTYLDDYYPDCGRWFSELVKVTAWLEQKWRPLVHLTGIAPETTEDKSSLSSLKHTWLQGLPKDSVAATYSRQRLADYERYASELQSYLIHRRKNTPAFHFHPIHRQLHEMYEDRKNTLAHDSGFMNVVGNRLLHLATEAQSSQKPARLNITALVRTIEDNALRRQW